MAAFKNVGHGKGASPGNLSNVIQSREGAAHRVS
jgi:hypothetical protein